MGNVNTVAKVDINLEGFRREWYSTFLELLTRKFELQEINGEYKYVGKAYA